MEAKILKWVMLLLCCIPLYFMVTLIGAKWRIGNGFPNENELTYEIGYLKGRQDLYYCDRRRCNYQTTIILTNSLNTATGQEYYCHYDYSRKQSCINKDILNEYRNQPAKIGYYVQPRFLWHQDNSRQLVTLEVNGKMVISYQDTINLIQQRKAGTWSFIAILITVILVFIATLMFIENHHKNNNHPINTPNTK